MVSCCHRFTSKECGRRNSIPEYADRKPLVQKIGSVTLDSQGNRVAAAEAKRRDAALYIPSLHFVEQRRQDAAA